MEEEMIEIEIRLDDPWNGQWRVAPDVEGREEMVIPEGRYLMTLIEEYET